MLPPWPRASPTPCTDSAVLPTVCDHCVVLLLDDLERVGALFPAIREQLRNVNTSSMAWARLHRLNASIADLKVLHGQPLSLPASLQALTFPSPY